ncbi:plastid division protein CDP1, chloroplastic [Ziziphus jujuba]|uniref:Plastid division protein CDP1, chloroplastic n=1 Tax=Ziziphus jujuba TaxID=326968 RepID=A0A6P3YQS4_ZIZJJ|nr:plastid division protein CDP1, chloroplastic [Ziziphus jujuba]
MAWTHAMSTIPSSCCFCRSFGKNGGDNSDVSCHTHKENDRVWVLGIPRERISSGSTISRASIGLRSMNADFLTARWRLNAVDTHIPQAASTRTSIEIPVTCYQLIGVTDRAEKDEVVKSVMDLKSAEIEDGYSMEAVVSRQDLLMDVRDKLLFEPEYAGDVKAKIPPKATLRIPWAWLPGALSLLQEVGEVKLVLDIGRSALQHPDAKPYMHDLLLSMALAECASAKIGLEKNKVSHGFEALARAQCLLRSKKSFGKLTLLSQIEESLEELAPACTLELLGMPHLPENAERRRGAISALRELLRQGLDVEAPRQVQDWPSFFSQSLNRLLASEIIDLLPWNDLAITRKNKKSLESQNQRVVIDSNCFYVALIAHIALGFSNKQRELIDKAKNICDCLIASEGINLKLEEAFCLFLLGEGNKAEVVEKVQQLELKSNPAVRNSVLGKDVKDACGGNQLLEKWLKDAVLTVFLDTRDCPPSLVNFFNGEKKVAGNKKFKGAPQTVATINHRPLSNTIVSERRDFEESLSRMSSSLNLGTAIKQLAPIDLQSSLIVDKNSNGNNSGAPSVQLKRNIRMHHNKVWESWLSPGDLVKSLTSVAVLGCIVFATVKLTRMNINEKRSASWVANKSEAYPSSLAWTTDYTVDNNVVPAYINGNGMGGRFKKLFTIVTKKFKNFSDAGDAQTYPAAGLSSMTAISRRLMPMDEAEALVKQWQTIKAEALGPSHEVHSLSEILDESMLDQWYGLADAAKSRSCYWRFVLLELSVLRAEILSNGIGAEMAEIEAVLEEAAELVNESEQKNPNYYSTYKIRYILKRQDDGSWRFCEGDIQTSS